MVACLEKTEGNSEFHEIVDFLTFSTIHYALTVSPTIYTSYIEQFWDTATSQTLNDEKQIHATVDSKVVVVTEASIRSSLLFNDVDGTACLTNEAIFHNITLIEGEGSGAPTEPQPTPSPTHPSTGDQPPVTESSSSHDTTQDSMDSLEGNNRSKEDQVQSPHDSPLLGDHTSDRAEGALNLEELFCICTNLSNRVLALESVKDAQATEIFALRVRIKKLEKKCKPSISHHRAWLKSVQRLSMKKKFGKKESVSKQERKKDKPTLDDSTLDDLDADHGIDTEEPMNQERLSEETKELVTTVRLGDSTVRTDVGTTDTIVPPTTTTSIFDDEDITMAQTLIKMKEEKVKEKGVSIKDIEDSSRPARSILTLKPLPTIDPKDKGKGVLEKPKPAKKMTRSDLDDAQITKDAEVARLVYKEELAELEREKEKRQREEEASKAAIAEMYDEIQAVIKFDALAAQGSAEITSRPPTKSQLKKLMMTYLKNMGGYKYSQLKAKTFVEIQGLYERQKRVIDDFKLMDSDDAVNKEKVLEKLDNTNIKVKQKGDEENIKKRPGIRLKMKATKNSKRQKTDSDLKEEERLKTFLQIVPDEEGEVDYDVLNKRFPIINWESKFYHLDRHGVECIYYRIFRSDGSSRWIKTFSEMINRFDRIDLEELYNLVMQRFKTTSPEGVDMVLWGNLRKTRYPLIKETLERMLALRFIAECESEAIFDLLRFIQKQIDESGSHDGSEKDLVAKVLIVGYEHVVMNCGSAGNRISSMTMALLIPKYQDYQTQHVLIIGTSQSRQHDKSEPVMAISVISISSDSSEDSMGTPAGRVILFGTIPTTISDTTPLIAPPTTDTPIIAPNIPPSPDYTPASPDYSPASEAESDPSEDPASGHIPPLPATSPFLSSDDDTTRSIVIPRCRVMILAPGQPIPHGRPYRYHPKGPVHMMTARKRVRPLPVQQLSVRHPVDHSSSDSSSRHPSSDHSSSDLPSTSAGPSRKRRRSPMTSVPALPLVSGALSLVRADSIPLPKRVRDIGYLADVEEGAAEVTYETLGDLVQRFHDHTQAIPVHRIQTTEGIQREQGCRIVGVKSAVVALTERVAELERDNQRFRGTASVESQRVNRLQRGMLRMQREMRQMRRFRFYDRVRVGRLEACARKHMVYRPLICLKMPNTRSRASMTHKEVKELIARRVAEEMEAHEVARNLEALNENEEEKEGENGGNENGGNEGNGNGDNGGNENGGNGG
nr:hypothetical protein [Tanacetum cinerariifolium]